MERTPLFSRIDTIILRVRDLERARAWYAETLGLTAVYHDADEGLAVLPVGEGGSVTLWRLAPGEEPPARDAAGSYPIFASGDAEADRGALLERGVEVGELTEAPGVRFFTFRDPDGNRLEACQVLDAAVEAGA